MTAKAKTNRPAKPSPKSKPTPNDTSVTKSAGRPGQLSTKTIPAWKKLKLARQKRFAKFNPRTQTQNLRRSFIGMRRGER